MGCHDALQDTSHRFIGTKWFIEFDIKGYFDNIDHQILVRLLKEKINDERFTPLIGWMLKAGYLEDWKFNRTHSGTPQNGVISPILANVYLHELDVFMTELCQRTHKGKERRVKSEYRTVTNKKEWLKRVLDKLDSQGLQLVPENGRVAPNPRAGWTRDEVIEEIRRLTEEQQKTRYYDSQDPNYRRLQYTSYADDFLLGFIGRKAEA